MAQPVIIIANAIKAKLIEPPREVKALVSELLSYLVEGYEHYDSFRNGSWDGRATFFSFRDATFPAGFVNAVYASLAQAGYRVVVKRKKPPEPKGPDLMTAYEAVNPFGVDPRYDYQPDTIRRLEKYGQMVAQISTGGGKSLVACTAVKRIHRPSIFLTTRQVLMYQMKRGFEEAGFKVGVMGDGEWSPTRGINVAMIQTIGRRLENEAQAEQTRKLLSLFELAILEEAHEAGSQTYFDVMNALPNAHYRLALTGTPFMRDDGEANMRLMAVSGQIGIRISEKLLIDRGILAKPYFRYVETPPNPRLKRYSNYQKAVAEGIVEHDGRNQVIVSEVSRAVENGLPAMVLVQRTKHGDILRRMFKETGIRCSFISGKDDQDTRNHALNRLKSGELQVLIGSTILDVGVDVPAVGMLALAGGGKAEIALRQRIGRTLRAKKRANVSFILDFEDGGNRYLKDHARQRRGIVEATPGFVEGVLEPGRDFPYHLLGG